MNCRIAFKKMERELGLLDSYIELSELSNRDFILNAKKYGNTEEFVKLKSNQHKIYVNTNSITQIENSFVLAYISMTYNAFEIFFDDFRIEYNIFSKDNFDYHLTKKGGKQITRLQYLFERFKELKEMIPNSHINLFNYFRVIRIKATHNNYEIKNIINAYEKLIVEDDFSLKISKKKEFKIEVLPNEYYNLNFHDWLMFTKLVKSIALKISKLTVPVPNNLISYYNLKRLNKYKSLQRKKEAIKKVVWSDFKIDNNFFFFDEINKLL